MSYTRDTKTAGTDQGWAPVCQGAWSKPVRAPDLSSPTVAQTITDLLGEFDAVERAHPPKAKLVPFKKTSR